MDIVMKLRDLRRSSGLRQQEVAARSGVGLKSLSSFESGSRTDTMKLFQLRRILAVYGVTLEEFFDGGPHSEEMSPEMASLAEELQMLPAHIRRSVERRFRVILDAALEANRVDLVQLARPSSDWELLTSRN